MYQEFFLSTSLIFFSKSDLSVSYLVFKTNPLISTLFTLATNYSYTVFFFCCCFFLTTSLFTTTLSLLKSTGTSTNLSISNLSTPVFKLPNFDFSSKLEVSITVATGLLLHN